MLGRNLINSVLTQIPVFILGIVSGVFSTRILGEEAKGVFSLFQANYLLFLLIFSFGIQTGIVYFISSKKYTEQVVAGISLTIFLVSSSILLGLLFITYYLDISSFYLPENYDTIPYLISLFVLFFLSFFNNLITSFFQARSKFNVINRISIINSVINAALFPILYFYLQEKQITVIEKFNYVLVATLILLLLNSIIWFYLYMKQIAIIPKLNTTIINKIKEFVAYSLLIYIGMFVNFFNYRLDLWIVNYYLDEKPLSHYSLAANIVQIILYLSVTIASVILPKLSNSDDDKRLVIFTQISRFSFSFFFLLVVVAFSTSFFIIPLMYGDEFVPTIIPFQILSIGILFSCITQIFSVLMVSSNRNIFNIIACSVGLVFTIVFDIYLIPKYNINGAAIATLISYFAIFIITYIFVITKTTIKTKNLFIPTKRDIRFLYGMVTKNFKS